MSAHTNHADHAATIDQIAQQLGDDQTLAREALLLAARLLQRDERVAHERLTHLLHMLDVGELLSVASIRLELAAVDGNVDASRAAAHVTAAGLILYPGVRTS